MRVRKVPAGSISTLSEEEWIDRSRRPYVNRGTACIPVKEGYEADCEIDERRPYRGIGYRMMGDIAVIQGTIPTKEEISELIEWKRPSCIILQERIDGLTRSPSVRVLYGEPHEVCHIESGIRYRLDPSKVMFSFGNRNEKKRIASLIKKSGRQERVADMFAGIGYFSLIAALSGARVDAIEINPVSHAYLKENISLNGLEKMVRPIPGNCIDCLEGKYDRIIMGHFESTDYLDHALEHAGSGTVIHLHTLADDPVDSIKEVVSQRGFTCSTSIIKVKKYAPGCWHRCVDVVLE